MGATTIVSLQAIPSAQQTTDAAGREGREALKSALGRSGAVAAVDLGAAKVTCFIMKPDGIRRGDRTLTTAGVGYVQSRGVRGGAIVNLDEASEAIAQAVERAGREADALRHTQEQLQARSIEVQLQFQVQTFVQKRF